MPTRYQHMFQPAPVAPQLPPDSHQFAVGEFLDGPWRPAVGAVKVPSPSVNCIGAPAGPGDCFMVTFDQGTIDYYLRATATATVDGLAYTAHSAPLPLPETNPGALFFLFVLVVMAVAGDNPRRPPGGTMAAPRRGPHTP